MSRTPVLYPGMAESDLRRVMQRSGRLRILLALISVIFLALTMASYLWPLSPQKGASASLIGYLYWLGIGGGSVALLAILRLTRAEWRRPFVRPAEFLTLFIFPVIAGFPFALAWRDSLPAYGANMVHTPVRWPWEQWEQAWIIDLAVGAAMLIVTGVLFWRNIAPDLNSHHKPLSGGKLRILSAVQLVFVVPGLAWFGYGFGMTRISGWESTLFGPYMIGTSLLHAAAALAVTAILLRRTLGLDRWLTAHHLDNLAKLMIGFILIWFYFNFAEFLTVWYGHIPREMAILKARTINTYPLIFGFVIGANFLIPLLYFSFPRLRRSIPGVFVISLLILVGGLAEWMLIFTPTGFGVGFFTIGRIFLLPGIFGLMIAVLLGVIPPLSIWEIEEGIAVRRSRRVGEKIIATYLLSDLPVDEEPVDEG